MIETELQAGKELDALVAEKVMGWHVGNYGSMWRNADWASVALSSWSPSTDISAAWLVWDHLDANTDIDWYLSRDAEGWLVETFDGDRDCWAFTLVSRGETAPLAICRAALRAVTRE